MILPAGVVPRLLTRDQAATYMGMSANSFEREVEAGRFPGPVKLSRVRLRLWDRAALDRTLDRASGIGLELAEGGDNRDERKQKWHARPGRSEAPR